MPLSKLETGTSIVTYSTRSTHNGVDVEQCIQKIIQQAFSPIERLALAEAVS